MEKLEINPDIEAINSTIEKIKYYLHLPAHIRGIAAALDSANLKESIDDGLNSPAHVVNGSITAVGGRINIPDICKISRLYQIDEAPLLIFN